MKRSLSLIPRSSPVVVVWGFKKEKARDDAITYKKVSKGGKNLGVARSFEALNSTIGKNSSMYFTYTWGRKVLNFNEVQVLYRAKPLSRPLFFARPQRRQK